MPSKPKTVRERLVGKDIKLMDGSVAKITDISKDDKTAKLNKGAKAFGIPVAEIETRGSRFYHKITNQEGTEMSNTAAPVVPEATATQSPAVEETTTTAEEIVEAVEKIAEIATNIVESIEAKTENTAVLTCQFCLHTFAAENAGMARPDSISDMCSDCLTLAEDRLLAVGIPGQDIIPEMVVEYLTRFYGMVNSDVVIQVIGLDDDGTICDAENTDSPCAGVGCTCDQEQQAEESAPEFETSAEEFLYARRAIAETLVRTINLVSGNASIGEETADAILLKLEPFDFELTALCGGYIISQGEAGMVREEEFTALDELFSYFCGETSAPDEDLELPEEEDDLEDDLEEETTHLPVGAFFRLQNCKNEENNKKLVKIIEVVLPETEDGAVIYRTIDKTGKTYKVTESKLKPSIKSF
jgi:hypothetical protein